MMKIADYKIASVFLLNGAKLKKCLLLIIFLFSFSSFLTMGQNPVLLNINTASLRDIAQLPGMNILNAQKILQYRSQQGGIKSLEQLVNAGLITSENAKKMERMVKFTDKDPELPVGRIQLDMPVQAQSFAEGKGAGPQEQKKPVAQEPGDIFKTLVSLIRDGRLDYAKPRLEKFIEVYPNSEWADDARYLMGAIEEEDGDHVGALNNYLALEHQYPHSDTYPLALLRIALCYDNLRKFDMALEYYQKVRGQRRLSSWHELCEEREKKLAPFKNK